VLKVKVSLVLAPLFILVSHLYLYFASKFSELHRETRKRKNDKMGTYYDTILDASSEKLSSEAAEVMLVQTSVVI
jgi:hypothetical protein